MYRTRSWGSCRSPPTSAYCEDAVDDAEDGGVEADAEPEARDRHEGEPRRAAEHADGVAQVEERLVDPRQPPGIAVALAGAVASAEAGARFDWIPMDPDIDFAAMYAGFSGLVMGRRSYDVFVATGGAVGLALPTYEVASPFAPSRHRPGSRAEPHGLCFGRT